VRAAKALADLRIDRIDDYLHSLHEDGYAPRAINHYIQALISFCNWAVTDTRLAANPLKKLTNYNAAADIRHKRRALNVDEVSSLIESARHSRQTIQGYGPELRARLYELAFHTGLRRKEIASLTPASFDLKSVLPNVTVAAACSKHRKTHVLPRHSHHLTLLPTWLHGAKLHEPLFPGLAGKKTWLMVKKELERAGIPYETPDGIADFHASGRHSYITELLRNGTSLAKARKLARHKDVSMTMRYTHIGLADQTKALAALPATKTSGTGQYIGRTAGPLTSDATSRPDTDSHKTQSTTSNRTVGA
jgi:integrase